MATETERKFLVDKSKWLRLEKPAGIGLRQGYLSTDPAKTIRVRIAGDKAWLTIKGTTTGISRTEIECPVPAETAEEMLDQFAVSELRKTRFYIPVGQKIWEVDEFRDDNEGLIVAELELEHETEPFELPEWVTVEVTEDSRYYNAVLSLHPYKDWVQ